MKRIAIFASGNGTNAQRIADYFRDHAKVEIALILCNKPDAYVLERAMILGIPTFVFSGKALRESDVVFLKLKEFEIDFVILAGFLLHIPQRIISNYRGRMVNIHPALLPKYGGRGMFGTHVHQAVLEAGETESGITIHYVNEHYDSGDIIFQAKCPVLPDDTVETLADRIHALEHEHFSKVIERLLIAL